MAATRPPFRPSSHAAPRTPPGRTQTAAPNRSAPPRGGPPARRAASSPADRFRGDADEYGTMGDRNPFLNTIQGNHVVDFVASRYDDEDDKLMVDVEIVCSDNDDVLEGSRYTVCKNRKGNTKEQTIMKKKEFTTFAVKAYGYGDARDLNDGMPNWAEDLLEETPAFIGRRACVEVYDSGRTTKDDEPICNERWNPSEEAA